MIERKHLVTAEVGKLIAAAKGGRNEARDRCLLLLMFRHGLRVSEACGLRLSQVDIESRVLHVLRLKKGLSATHPLRTDEVRVIKGWLAERRRWNPPHDAFFVSERRTPLNRTDRLGRDPGLWGESGTGFTGSSAHVAACLRVCPGRSGGGHSLDTGLSRSPEHSAHGHLYRCQSGSI